MNNEIDWELIRKTYPYMEKNCGLCAWAFPSANLDREDEWCCSYFDKEVLSRQAACDFFVNRYVRYLL